MSVDKRSPAPIIPARSADEPYMSDESMDDGNVSDASSTVPVFGPKQRVNGRHEVGMIKTMSHFLERYSGEGCAPADCHIICNGRRYEVHYMVLAMHSAGLAQLAKNRKGVKGFKQVRLPATDEFAVGPMVQYFYDFFYDVPTPSGPDDATTLGPLAIHTAVVAIADKYGIRPLKRYANEEAIHCVLDIPHPDHLVQAIDIACTNWDATGWIRHQIQGFIVVHRRELFYSKEDGSKNEMQKAIMRNRAFVVEMLVNHDVNLGVRETIGLDVRNAGQAESAVPIVKSDVSDDDSNHSASSRDSRSNRDRSSPSTPTTDEGEDHSYDQRAQNQSSIELEARELLPLNRLLERLGGNKARSRNEPRIRRVASGRMNP